MVEEKTKGKGQLSSKLQETIDSRVDALAGKNGGVGSMKYFYDFAKGLNSKRIEELERLKGEGKKVVGTFCTFAPEELILAAGAIPLRLDAGFQGTIAQAEEVLPRNFCPLIKSSFGMAMDSHQFYELADVVVTPMTCDGKKKLGEMLSKYKAVWSMEVPHTTETQHARDLWLRELHLFAGKLEKLTGRKISPKKLAEAIELVNAKRAALRKIYETRKEAEVPIFGRDVLLATSMSFLDDSARWTEHALKLALELSGKKKGVANARAPRILITGCPVVMPTWKVPDLVEDSGGIIVADEVCTGAKALWDPVEVEGTSREDMLIALADKYLMNNCACFTPNIARVDGLVQFSKEFRINGVVYNLLQACHTYGMEANRIEKALERLGVPMLRIETDYSEEDIEQIRTRVEAFLEMIQEQKK